MVEGRGGSLPCLHVDLREGASNNQAEQQASFVLDEMTQKFAGKTQRAHVTHMESHTHGVCSNSQRDPPAPVHHRSHLALPSHLHQSLPLLLTDTLNKQGLHGGCPVHQQGLQCVQHSIAPADSARRFEHCQLRLPREHTGEQEVCGVTGQAWQQGRGGRQGAG
jgi:hypothetical protein